MGRPLKHRSKVTNKNVRAKVHSYIKFQNLYTITHKQNWKRWYMPVTSAIRRLRKEGRLPQVLCQPGYIVSSRPSWVIL